MPSDRKKTPSTPRARKPKAAPRVPSKKAPAEEEAEVVEADLVEATPEGEPEEFGDLEPEGGKRPARTGAIVPAGQTGLVSRDPLAVYMAEVRKHSLLSREEEHRLAVRYRETGDVDAAYRLVSSNLRLVVKLAHEYHRNPISVLDLIQEGNIGLMQAVKKYDPYRGVKLSSYAAWWIRAYILRYVMENWKMVKLGTTEAQRKLFFKLRQEQEKLSAQGYEVTPKLLADRLSVTEQDVVEMDQRLSQDEVSLDLPVGEDGKATRADRLLAKDQAPADEALASAELKEIFRRHLSEFARTLEGKEKFIFEKRLVADEPLTLQEIGNQYGVSRERARQIEAGLIHRIRDFLRQRIPDFDLVASPEDS